MTINFFQNLKDHLDKSRSNKSKELLAALNTREDIEIWIVFAGKGHVGKTTLRDYIFEPKDKSVRTRTPEPDTRVIELKGQKGKIKYTDLPGFGRSTTTKQEIEAYHREYLNNCDLVVWIFRCDDDTFEKEQEFYNSLSDKVKQKMIFGLSKLDSCTMSDWDNTTNTPSEEQSEYIYNRIIDIHKELNIDKKKIFPFSVKKKYKVDLLVKAMIKTIQKKSDILRTKISETI